VFGGNSMHANLKEFTASFTNYAMCVKHGSNGSNRGAEAKKKEKEKTREEARKQRLGVFAFHQNVNSTDARRSS
jgi:hypothetical protein